MNILRARFILLPISALGLVAWLAISNHCALAVFEVTGKQPMTCCQNVAGTNHEPVKNEQQSKGECCQTLRATLSTWASALAAPEFCDFDYPVRLLTALEESRQGRVIGWDTGPPVAESFAEAVLQRSLLAHAPPFRA